MRATVDESWKARVIHGTWTHVHNLNRLPTEVRQGWFARHGCGWSEFLDEWHNAFWAADHHVRYDCGRRGQVSSGSLTREFDQDGRLAAVHVNETGVYLWSDFAGLPNLYQGPFNEGGMQKHPTPSDNGHPPISGSADDPGAGR